MIIWFNSELDATKHGWQQYYWNPIKATFGFGSFLTDVLWLNIFESSHYQWQVVIIEI